MNVKKRSTGLFLLLLALPILLLAFPFGPPSGVTGGFGEPTCTSCHGGIENSGPGSVTVAVPQSYTSGTTFPITVTVSDPNQRRWGFELSARTQSGQQAGNLIAGGDGFSQLLPPSNGIQYIGHTTDGTRLGTTGGVTFNFSWQAPDVSAGPVVFHVAANAADGDNTSIGDRIYTSSATASPEQVSGPPPSVNEGGVVNNASYTSASSALAPGTIAAIFGTNMTDGRSCLPPGCNPTVGGNGKLDTTMAGAEVKINGTPAPPFYASPLQLGVQIPTELTGTSATVEVTVNNQSSTPRTILLDTATPGIFTFSQDGQGAGAITHADGSAVTSQSPARPGEVVILYGTGLGAVNPPIATGVLPGSTGVGPHRAVAAVRVSIDGLEVEPEFAGLSGCCAGLNQINLKIPETTRSANDIPVRVVVGGKQSNPVTIAVSATN